MKFFLLLGVLLLFLSGLNAHDYTIAFNPWTIEAGDYDGDGDNDLVIGHIFPGSCVTFLNNDGTGNFYDEYILQYPGGIRSIFDIDENGCPDVIFNAGVAADSTSHLEILYNHFFTLPYAIPMGRKVTNSLGIGDFNDDLLSDIVINHRYSPEENCWSILYQNPDHTFTDPYWQDYPDDEDGEDACGDLWVSDFDADGRDDFASSGVFISVYFFEAINLFSIIPLETILGNKSNFMGDLDGDGDQDLIVSQWSGGPTRFWLYENTGDRNFSLHQLQFTNAPFSPGVCADMNGDGFDDILMTHADWEFCIYYSDGAFGLTPVLVPISNIPCSGEWINSADFDGNGTPDVAILRDDCEENNLTIVFNDGNGNFQDEPVEVTDSPGEALPSGSLRLITNPARSSFEVEYELPAPQLRGELRLYNLRGQKLCSRSLEERQGQLSIPARSLPSGIYLVALFSGNYIVMSSKVCLLK